MKGRVFSRFGGGEADPRSRIAVGSEDWKLAINDAEFLVVREQLFDVSHCRAAIAAVVIEELDNGHVSVRRAFPCASEGRFKGFAVCLYDFRGFALTQLVHRFGQDFWVRQNILADNLFDDRAVSGRNGCVAGGGYSHRCHSARRRR